MTINTSPQNTPHKTEAIRRRFIYIVIGLISFVGFIALLILMMPKGFKTSLDEIGQGKPALVFVYDPNRAISPSQFEQMNIARDQVNEMAFFLSAKIATPQGDAFIKQHNAEPAELFLFDSTGHAIERGYAPKSAQEILNWIKKSNNTPK